MIKTQSNKKKERKKLAPFSLNVDVNNVIDTIKSTPSSKTNRYNNVNINHLLQQYQPSASVSNVLYRYIMDCKVLFQDQRDNIEFSIDNTSLLVSYSIYLSIYLSNKAHIDFIIYLSISIIGYVG
jgi:hypothetical protein